MGQRIPEFLEQLKKAPTDPQCERIVRYMLEEIAKDGPLWVVIALGHKLVEIRKDEMHEEAERN